MKKYLLIFLFLILALPAFGADTFTLKEGIDGYTGWTDASLDAADTTTNDGNAGTIEFSPVGNGSYNSWVAFKASDLSNCDGATDVTGTFGIYYNNNSGYGGTWDLHRLKRDWTEGDGSSGSGIDWATYDGSSSWSSGGAEDTTNDRTATPDGTFTKVAWDGSGYKEFGISQLLQDWIDGTYQNYGFIIRSTTFSGDDGGTVESSENATAGERPYITMTCTPSSGGSRRIIISN